MQGDVLLPAYTDNMQEVMNELLIFLGSAMCGSFVSILLFLCDNCRQIKRCRVQKRRLVFMFKRKSCPKCKTGKYTYELDKHSSVCPYIGWYSRKKCPMYVKLEKPQKGGFWENIFGNGKVTPRKQVLCSNLEPHVALFMHN